MMHATRAAAAIFVATLLTAGLAGCEASPEVKRLCKQYVDQQVRLGKAKSADKSMDRCLRYNEKQVRCLLTASGRNAKTACTQ